MITKISQRRITRATCGELPIKPKITKEVEQKTLSGSVSQIREKKKGKNEKDHSIIKEKEYSNRGHIPKEHTKRYWEIITKLAKEQNTTDEKDIATLIVKADRNWKRDEIMRKDSKDRTSSLLCFQPPPKTNLIELSMIFETLRGELPCRIPIVEKAFGLKKYLKDNNIFIIQIVSMTQIQFDERIKNDNTIQEKRKKIVQD